MSVRALSHVAIGVRDMERALVFYRDALGLRVNADQIEEVPAFGGAEARKRRAVYLRWAGGPHASFVVLDQQLSAPPFGEPAQLFQVGVHHWSLWVDDAEAIVARAAELGFDVVVEANESDTRAYGEPPGGVVVSAFLRDPDGNLVQLDQRVSAGAGDPAA